MLRFKPTFEDLADRLHHIETSKAATFCILLVIFSTFVTFELPTIYTDESGHDYQIVKDAVISWHPDIGHFDLHVKYSLLLISLKILGNIRIIPIISTLSLLSLTYLTTKSITGKRLHGVIAITILSLSHIVFLYGALSTYTTFWVAFYLASIYVTFGRLWYLSPILFILGFDSKPLIGAYVPMSIYFIHSNLTLSRKNKNILYLSYATIVTFSILEIIKGVNYTFSPLQFNPGAMYQGTIEWWGQLMSTDMPFALCFVPLLVSFMKLGNKISYGKSILFMIIGIGMSYPLLTGLTYMTNEPYRIIPLIVFMSIGIGAMFTMRRNQEKPSIKTM